LHQHEIIHRDIKPSNWRCPPEQPHWWLVDLGAIKPLTATRLARPGTVVGSAAYAAPEQLRGEATYASDLYSLGVVCLHLLTGLKPFDLFDGVNGCWHWRSVVPDVSPLLATVLDAMVQPALRDRLPTTTAVMTRLAIPLPPTPEVAAPAARVSAAWPARLEVKVATEPRALAVSGPTARLLVLAADQVEVRSLSQPATLCHSLSLKEPLPTVLATHPQQPVFVIGTRLGTLEQWLYQGSGWAAKRLPPLPHGITHMVFNAAGTALILADEQGHLHWLDWDSGWVQATWLAHNSRITALALCHNDTVLASGDVDGQVKLWSGSSGVGLRTLSRQPGAITALAWLSDDQALITASWDVCLRWRCPNSGRVLQMAKAQGFYLPIRSLLAHPTAPYLITGSQDGQLLYWHYAPECSQSLEAVHAIAAAAPQSAPITHLSFRPGSGSEVAQVLSLNSSGYLMGRSLPS
jgi:hypothetical protein